MISKYIFIDTQAYEAEKYNFGGEALKKIVDLCQNESLHLAVTESVMGEVEAHFSKCVDKVTSAIGSVRNESRLIRHISCNSLEQYIAPPDKDKILNDVICKWRLFLKQTNAFVIPASHVDASELLKRYFSSSPPFKDGKKKHEFPDAISALSLEWWIKVNNINIVVIGQDGDFEAWAKSRADISVVKSIKEYINLYNIDFEKQSCIISKIILENEDRFCEVIYNYFSDCHFDIYDMSEANIASLEFYYVSLEDVDLIKIADKSAVVSIDFEVDFSANIEFPDYINSIYNDDQEEYVYLPHDAIEKKFKENYSIIVEFEFDSVNNTVIAIRNLYFEDGPYVNLSMSV